jgi:hypothetical protein
MSAWATRLPSGLSHIAAVMLMYYVGWRLFDRSTGLVAAALLTVCPWAFALSRMATSSGTGLVSVSVLGTLALFLRANLPFDDGGRPVRPVLGALAGAVAAVACYGYWSVRLFLPALLLSAVLATCRSWWALLKTRCGAAAVAATALAGLCLIAPLAHAHLTDPDMNARARMINSAGAPAPPAARAAAIISRYASHFGPDFLFLRGDLDFMHAGTNGGVCYWFMLPGLAVGLAVVLRRLRRSRAARVVLAWLVLFPVADLFGQEPSPHLLRSSPGASVLVLLSAVGTVAVVKWLWRRRPAAGAVAGCVLLVASVACASRYVWWFFEQYPRRVLTYHGYGVDLLEAARWLKPRLANVDAVFCTSDANQPFAYMLVGLGYDPRQWHRPPHETATTEGFDEHVSFGKFHFLYPGRFLPAWDELERMGQPVRVVFIVRPGETALTGPVYQVRRPDGKAVLLIFELSVGPGAPEAGLRRG